jgi:hypothetical protein
VFINHYHCQQSVSKAPYLLNFQNSVRKCTSCRVGVGSRGWPITGCSGRHHDRRRLLRVWRQTGGPAQLSNHDHCQSCWHSLAERPRGGGPDVAASECHCSCHSGGSRHSAESRLRGSESRGVRSRARGYDPWYSLAACTWP